jgi:hypothetical protein
MRAQRQAPSARQRVDLGLLEDGRLSEVKLTTIALSPQVTD